jgi:hypothetical protein
MLMVSKADQLLWPKVQTDELLRLMDATDSVSMIDMYFMVPIITSLVYRNSREDGEGPVVLGGYANLWVLQNERAVLVHRGTVLDVVSNLDNS